MSSCWWMVSELIVLSVLPPLVWGGTWPPLLPCSLERSGISLLGWRDDSVFLLPFFSVGHGFWADRSKYGLGIPANTHMQRLARKCLKWYTPRLDYTTCRCLHNRQRACNSVYRFDKTCTWFKRVCMYIKWAVQRLVTASLRIGLHKNVCVRDLKRNVCTDMFLWQSNQSAFQRVPADQLCCS